MKKELSDKYSLYSRKYFLGILFILIGFILILSPSILNIFISLFLFFIGFFYINLKRILFDSEFIYIGNKKYEFRQIKKYRTIEINMFSFPFIEIDDLGKKRRYITDIGSASIIRIFLGIIFPKLDPYKNLKEFKENLDKSRN